MAPKKLVYSFAPADLELRGKLSIHLNTLVLKGLITEWHEQLIPAGANVDLERQRAWNSAEILLLLLSADYFVSPDYESKEMQQALKRQQLNQLLIIPILLRPCNWQATAIAHLKCLPKDGVAVSGARDQDAVFLAIVQEISQLISSQFPSTLYLSPLQLTNRDRLLKRVRTIWIDGLLEQSLYHAVWVDLHLQKQPDALENPWRLVVQELDRDPRPLPEGTSIIQVFDEADEELLILGEAGAGKTTLLLYLARTLLDRAEADKSRRMPVIFHLASWAQQRLPLEQWLVEELKRKYQIVEQIGRTWVETDQIFPLLDGLDEVADPARSACAQAIIAYTQGTENRTPLVVCCRSEEYQALSVQLPLQYAVMLLPFTNEQIDMYLSSVSGKLEVLRQAFSEDRDLFELARRPLLLSIFALAYQGVLSVDLPTTIAHQDSVQALFRYYVKHMLTRRTRLQQATEEQAYRWLTYLATQLHSQGQTIFAIEDLQPTWLTERARRWYRWSMVLVYGLTFGLVFGPVFGLAFGCVYGFLNRSGLIFGLQFGLIVGLIGGLIGGLVFGVTFKHHQTIQPAEITSWSQETALKGLLLGLAGGVVVGAVGGLIGSIVAASVVGGIAVGLVATLLVGVVGGLVGGLSPGQLSERISLVPNEGIWRSGRRGLLFVVVCVTLFGLAGGLLVALFGKSIESLAYGSILGVALGATGGLIFGLAFGRVGGRTGMAAFLQHFVLRFFLWRLNLLPWHLIAFLDEATDRLLLRKIGGNYIFVHRLLRDVLAKQTVHSAFSDRRDLTR